MPTAFESRRGAGFTLLELIVAAGILALIAVFSWRGLDTLVREREGIAASQETIDLMQRSFARIERDVLLASDAQLDEDGTMRLVAGPGGGTASVEYRLVDGTLTRTIVGSSDARPLAMIDNIASLAFEAWMPGPRGGGWVRVKVAATEAPKPAANAAPGSATQAAQPQDNTAASGAQPPQQPAASRPGPAAPVVAAATGIRFSLARNDGSRVIRSFIIGGA